jgi:hypothetical protein
MATKSNEEQIFIGNDDMVVELLGKAKDEFIAERNKLQAEYSRIEAAEKEKAEKKESATNKLKALGLTDAEVEALLG